jgi:hypothetical protein
VIAIGGGLVPKAIGGGEIPRKEHGMEYHVDANGVVIPVEEQARNESTLNGINLVDADGNRRSMASVLLRKQGKPVRRRSNVIRVQGKAPRQ